MPIPFLKQVHASTKVDSCGMLNFIYFHKAMEAHACFSVLEGIN